VATDAPAGRRRIWVDIEDLLAYAESYSRPSGIQRLAFEIYRELVAIGGDDVRFVRHLAPPGLAEVSWDEVRAVFARMDRPVAAAKARGAAAPTASDAGLRGWLRRFAFRMPSSVQRPLMRALRAQRDAALGFGEAAVMAATAPARWMRRRWGGGGADVLREMRPGDVFLALGSPWFPFYERRLEAARARGARVGVLVYDLIPVMRPEWCDASLVRTFCNWMRACLPVADRVFAISGSTARDTERFAAADGFALARPVVTLPIGTGFSGTPAGGEPTVSRRGEGLPEAGSYVLFVSTIEPRKNHPLLFRVWRELLVTMPRESVPTLVFAGRVGWMSGDFMRQLRNADWLDGAILHVNSPTDAELTSLYEGALFTIFPSLYEGWGLPVTESLAHGKPCLVARTTSLPEAGGALARYFDPDNLHEAVDAVRTLIGDRAGIAAWEAEIRARFRPTPWRETAMALLDFMEKIADLP
jgi:glycosyltransferase involved in cell wall biosynthesis